MDDHTRGPYWAKRGMNQMVEPNATTVACLGTPDGQGPFWFIFSDAEQHGDQEQTAQLLANSWHMRAVLEIVAALSLSQFASPLDMALECVDVAAKALAGAPPAAACAKDDK